MKNLFKIFAMCIVVVLATACTSVRQTAPVMAIGGNNIVTNVKADIDFKNVEKISGDAVNHRVLWIFNHTPNGNKQLKANNKYKGLNKCESIALYRAKAGSNVDMVLEPQFETETHSYFFGIYKRTQVHMTGWGANIKGFQDCTPNCNHVESFGGEGLF